MSRYAEGTSVPMEKSRAEIERDLGRYGASHFGYMTTPEGAELVFQVKGVRVRLNVKFPPLASFSRTEGRGLHRSASAAGGWVCEVWQSAYGHRARKRTWLYAVGPRPPELRWERTPGSAQVGWFDRIKPTLSKREASATPTAFRDALLDIARNCRSAEREALREIDAVIVAQFGESTTHGTVSGAIRRVVRRALASPTPEAPHHNPQSKE